jgi:two-component system response regulator DesR
VRNHVSSILRKLDVDTRQRAVIEAHKIGWI